MENMSIVHGNKHKLSCVEEKGHCSERIDSLEPRVILEGIERLLWPVGFGPLLLWGKSGDQRPIGRPRTQTLWQRVPRGPEQPEPRILELGSREHAYVRSSSSEPSQPTGKNENCPALQSLAFVALADFSICLRGLWGIATGAGV